jgi:DNA mismatch endonuclease (patch repair protein)
MQRQRRAGTEPEIAVRRAVHRLGLRYFVDRRPIPSLRRSADLVFPGAKVAVFVDGCFWHGCPLHGRSRRPTNDWYWPAKIASNMRRDGDTNDRLIAQGWLPLRVWEHEDAQAAAELIRAVVLGRRTGPRATMRPSAGPAR